MGVKIDLTQVKELKQKLESISQNQLDACAESCVKELAARMLRKVIKRTPAGKKPTLQQFGGNNAKATVKVKGKSGKSHSMLSREDAILQQYWSGYKGGTLRNSWTATNVEKRNGEYRCEVVNPIYYASYVENGHRQKVGRYVPAIGKRLKKSWVSGKLMLYKSEQEVNNVKDAVVKKKVDKLLAEVFQ